MSAAEQCSRRIRYALEGCETRSFDEESLRFLLEEIERTLGLLEAFDLLERGVLSALDLDSGSRGLL